MCGWEPVHVFCMATLYRYYVPAESIYSGGRIQRGRELLALLEARKTRLGKDCEVRGVAIENPCLQLRFELWILICERKGVVPVPFDFPISKYWN